MTQPPVETMLKEFGYAPEWLHSGLLSPEFLELQWRNARADAEWMASDKTATEHWRAGALGDAVRHPAVLSGEKLADLLHLLRIDPDRGCASSYAYQLVSGTTGLPPALMLVVAEDPAMGLGEDPFEEARRRLDAAGLPQARIAAIVRTQLDFADGWTQARLLRGGRLDKASREYLSVHGKNARVRRYARHGLRRPPPTDGVAPEAGALRT